MVSMREALRFYRDATSVGSINDIRYLAQKDLFFLLRHVFGRNDIEHEWLYERIREFEVNPDGHLDLWARDHYKSTIITFAGTIQEVLRNPNVTIGIFSHTRPIAKGFLRQIKREFEGNKLLQELFPHIMPPSGKEARTWSEDGGLCVLRTSNPKEQTIEAWGLVDGQPTSKHFNMLVYDDVVTRESVTTADMIKKVTDAWSLSLNLGSSETRVRMIGTRYHSNDTYRVIIEERDAVKPRIYPATKNGQADGESVFLAPEVLEQKKRMMGSYIFACQMLQKPMPDGGAIFRQEWIRHWLPKDLPKRWDRVVQSWDMAFKDKEDSDFVVGQVWGVNGANAFLLDQVRGRLSFTATLKAVIDLSKKWPAARLKMIEDKANGPAVMNALKDVVPGFRPIEPYGSKVARAHAITAMWESGNVLIPHPSIVPWVAEFTDELLNFPVCRNDDQIDAMTQALDEIHKKPGLNISNSAVSQLISGMA